MSRWLVLAVALPILAGACSKSSDSHMENGHADNGLPAASNWSGGSGGFGDQADPHKAPHGKIGTDVSKMGLPPPDPKRPLDPTHHIRGTIRVAAALKDHVKPGTALFIVAKHPDASGNPAGSPLAVMRMTWDKDGMPFELSEAQAMIAGTSLEGDVVVTAHYDQDSDALSQQPGDVTGRTRATVPAEGIQLMLDTLVP